MTQLTFPEMDDTVGVAVGQGPSRLVTIEMGPTTEKAERLSIKSCALCKKYYADWMRSMNSGKQRMLRRLHKGNHLHGNSNDSTDTPET